MTSEIQQGKPFSAEETQRIVEQFNRDGYYFFGEVFTQEEAATLKALMEQKHNDPRMHDEAGDHIRGVGMMRMFEYDKTFRDLIVREPYVSLAEAILGEDCHMMSQNALRYGPGQGGGWHSDDKLHFPLPDDVPRHDPRITLPCFVINVLIPLINIETIDDGPTQVVPGSHYSGRKPPAEENPTFEGKGPSVSSQRQAVPICSTAKSGIAEPPTIEIRFGTLQPLHTVSGSLHSGSIHLSTTGCLNTSLRGQTNAYKDCWGGIRREPSAKCMNESHYRKFFELMAGRSALIDLREDKQTNLTEITPPN